MFGMNIPAANASGFVNGSFEADNWSGSGGVQLDLGTAGLTGWTVGSLADTNVYPAGVNNSSSYGPAPDGTQG